MNNAWFENMLSLASELEGVLPELEVYKYMTRGATQKAFVCAEDIPSALQKLWDNLGIRPTDIVSLEPVAWNEEEVAI